MIGEFENRQSTVPITFSFRGLDIRYRLPDRKGVGIFQASEERLVLCRGFDTPGRCVPSHLHHRSYPRPVAISPFAGRGLLPRYDCCAFSASHRSGLFLPQRDPEILCAHAHE